MVASAAVLLFFRLRTVPMDTLLQVLQGLGAIACALAGLGILLWSVRWGVTRDDAQEKLREKAGLGPPEREK
jgi:hypothetical protein